MKDQFKTVHEVYKLLAVDTDEELEEIKNYHDKLKRELQQLTKNLVNYKNIRDTVKDLTRRCNIVYHKLKEAELAKSNEIGRVVS